MKKHLLLIITIIIVIISFTACSSNSNNNDDVGASTTIAATKQNDDKESETSYKKVDNLVTTQIAKEPIENAKISGYEATQIISGMDVKKLGLKGKTEDYRFMVSPEGKVIEDQNYIEVNAMEITQENDDGTMSVDIKGNYFVSYDGKKILVRDLTTGEFSELK